MFLNHIQKYLAVILDSKLKLEENVEVAIGKTKKTNRASNQQSEQYKSLNTKSSIAHILNMVMVNQACSTYFHEKLSIQATLS